MSDRAAPQQANGGARRDINEPTGVTGDVLQAIQATCDSLSKGRKKRPVPEGLPKPDEVAGWSAKEDVAPHQASKPGVLCLDVAQYDDSLLVTGGNDKEAIVYDRKAQQVGRKGGRQAARHEAGREGRKRGRRERKKGGSEGGVSSFFSSVVVVWSFMASQVVSKLKGHGKKVTAVVFAGKTHEGLVLTGTYVTSPQTTRRAGRQARAAVAVRWREGHRTCRDQRGHCSVGKI